MGTWNLRSVSPADGDDCGQYALAQAQALLHARISSWPRRGRNLVLIGCGAGCALELFWGAGFDVTGVEPDAELYSLAAERLGPRADLRLGNLGCLPFEDDFFDYAAVMDLPGATPYAEPFIDRAMEACRLARRGVLLAFMNAWSLHGLAVRCARLLSSSRARRREHIPQHWGGLLYKLRNAGFHGKSTSASTLFGPGHTWRNDRLNRLYNERISALPWGAFMVGRLDFAPAATFTGLLVPSAGKKAPAEATAGPYSSASCEEVLRHDVLGHDVSGNVAQKERS